MTDVGMQSMSSGALSRTLLSITETKINEVTKKLKAFESQKSSILGAVEAETDERKKVQLLLDGLNAVRNCFNLENAEASSLVDAQAQLGGVSMKNVRRFLDQSRFDPSVSPSLFKDWERRLKLELDIQGVRYDYAYLFGRLVTEWLSSLTPRTPSRLPSDEGKLADSEASDAFIALGRKEMYVQREQWESYVNSPMEMDVTAIENYLKELFTATKDSKQALEALRENVKDTGTTLIGTVGPFDQTVVKWCIKALLHGDLLSDEKRAILVDFSINETVLTEVADVLNLRLASLDTWNWDPEGVPIEMKRKLNGKYRVFMDEDILDALFLQYIGVKWGVGLKKALDEVVNSTAWKKLSNNPMTTIDMKRREFFLGAEEEDDMRTIQNERLDKYKETYFMTQLPSSEEAGPRGYDTINDSDDDVKSGADIKQSLLHLLSTESLLNTRLYGKFTIIQSDFKWFGPSLPHSTIFAVLKFFGVSEQWMAFFQRFVETPVKFSQDGANAQPRPRKRGIPMGHALSDVFGEILLFCMDFAVNQGTDGAILYRLHDDFWFWGQEQRCVNAWKIMNQFANVMGISFNDEKTGCVQITKSPSKDGEVSHVVESLPRGGIRWGFLKLDPNTGHFVVDRSLVDMHTAELQLQLAACKSIFAWVQAWNSYLARFFVANFCEPVNCFGRQHVDMIIGTFESIQRTLFGLGDNAAGGSVTAYLKKMLFERFGVTDVPDGFFYFPIELGGLGLHNPFISLFAMRETICKNPVLEIEKAFEAEELRYRKAKEDFENRSVVKKRMFQVDYVPENPDEFMELEEFTRYVEETSTCFHERYEFLLEVPQEESLEDSPGVMTAICKLEDKGSAAIGKSGIHSSWYFMEPYYKWVVELYGTDVLRKFGGLRLVDAGLLPVGIVRMLQGMKMQWEG